MKDSKIYSQLKEHVRELIEKRDRTGKNPLTREQRIEILNKIYDGSLYLWLQMVMIGSFKGSGALSYQLERARLELDSWREKAHKRPITSSEINKIKEQLLGDPHALDTLDDLVQKLTAETTIN